MLGVRGLRMLCLGHAVNSSLGPQCEAAWAAEGSGLSICPSLTHSGIFGNRTSIHVSCLRKLLCALQRVLPDLGYMGAMGTQPHWQHLSCLGPQWWCGGGLVIRQGQWNICDFMGSWATETFPGCLGGVWYLEGKVVLPGSIELRVEGGSCPWDHWPHRWEYGQTPAAKSYKSHSDLNYSESGFPSPA